MPETDKTEALPITFTPMVLGTAPTQRLCSMLESTQFFGVLPRPGIEKLTVYARAYASDTDHVVVIGRSAARFHVCNYQRPSAGA